MNHPYDCSLFLTWEGVDWVQITYIKNNSVNMWQLRYLQWECLRDYNLVHISEVRLKPSQIIGMIYAELDCTTRAKMVKVVWKNK